MNLVLALTIGVLYACGVWLLLQRSLSRIVIGLAVLGHGANLLLLAAGGPAGSPPIAGSDPATTADPLPQALALTAIVITFGMTALAVILMLRSFLETGSDQVDGAPCDNEPAADQADDRADDREDAA